MYRYIAVILLCLVTANTVAANKLQPITKPAPPLHLKDLSGRTVSLDEFKGKVVLLNFWASWCPPCREEMPSFWRLYKKINHPDFRVVLVNLGETRDTITAFMPEKIIQDLVMLSDPESSSGQEWKVRGLPHTFLVDNKGRLRFEYRGARQWDEKDDITIINNLLNE